jgi:hypothetical protein
VSSSKQAVLCCLKTNTTNGNYRVVGSNLAKPQRPLVREFAEELGAVVEVARIIDCWLYEVLPQREVVIITYGVKRCDREELRVSDEHRRFGRFTLHEVEALPMPEGYRRSIRAWLVRPDQ